MAINIYWASLQDEWMRAEEPSSLSKTFYSRGIHDPSNPKLNLNYCPSFNKSLKNIFEIKSMYDYSFRIEEGKVISDLYDQRFFDQHVVIRDVQKKVFSFIQETIFFTEEDSLQMSSYQFPWLENNAITQRCMPIPGTFDIGKWFRNIEFPFILKGDFNEFEVNYGDVMYYIKFHTDEKINFKQFIFDSKMMDYLGSSLAANNNTNMGFSKGSMDTFYKLFRHKKRLIKDIKANLIE
jgi:hypothetical protein